MSAPVSHNRRRIVFFLLGVGVAVGIVVFAARRERAQPIPLVPAPDTTFITGPLDANGNLDYESAVNLYLKRQVQPEDNAVLDMLQVFGPKLERSELLPEVYQWLGCSPPPEQGEYFVTYQQQFARAIQPGQATEFATHLDEMIKIPWKSQKEPLLAAWLTANARPLEKLTQASLKPKYYFPLVSMKSNGSPGSLVAVLLPIAQPYREAAKVLSLRVALHCGEGRFDQAWDDVLTIHRLGRQIVQGGTIIESLVGVAIKSIGIQAAQLVLESSTPTPAQVLKWRESLAKLLPFEPRLVEKISWCERLTCLNFVDLCRQGDNSVHQMLDPKEREVTQSLDLDRDRVDWNAVFRAINDSYHRLESAAFSQSRIERVAAFDAMDQETRGTKREQEYVEVMTLIRKARSSVERSEAGTKLGVVFARLLMPGSSKVFEATDRLEQQQRHLELALALTAYYADHQKYPERLSELVPPYTQTILLDVFSQAPPNYRLTSNGFVLSSVGKNGVNDTHHSEESLPTMFNGDDFGLIFQRR